MTGNTIADTGNTIADAYMSSRFARSKFCAKKADQLQPKVNEKMGELAREGIVGNLAARVVSPFMGVGALLASLCLRVGSIIEPIIGLLVDLVVAIACFDKRPLGNMLSHCTHIFHNLAYGIGDGVKDIYELGLKGIVGIFAPQAIYPRY